MHADAGALIQRCRDVVLDALRGGVFADVFRPDADPALLHDRAA